MHQRNQYDVELENLHRKMEKGGPMPTGYVLDTPTGRPTELNFIEQILVRSSAFKNWFGDWEKAAESFLKNPFSDGTGRKTYYEITEDFYGENSNWLNMEFVLRVFDMNDSFKGVSKGINMATLEPQLFYHGSPRDEFYEFSVTNSKFGRPYGYFAKNAAYSANFLRGRENNTLFKVFVNIKNPLIFNPSHSPDSSLPKSKIREFIATSMAISLDTDSSEYKSAKKLIDSTPRIPLDDYIDTMPDQISPWLLMARDRDRIFKQFLLSFKFDGIFYGEEFITNFDKNNPAEFTKACVIFYPNQVKLADGRNTSYDMDTNDIRYEEGGRVNNPQIMLPDTQSRYAHLKAVLDMQGFNLSQKAPIEYERGGDVHTKKGVTTDGKKGGYFEGRSHAEGGIKAHNVDTDSPIEVEGGEVIITKKAVDDPTKREFQGKQMTNREILSAINQSGGGVSFEHGGQVSEHMAKHGMEIHKRKCNYGHRLMRKMRMGGHI